MAYKVRVILNMEEDAIRDIAIDEISNLEDLHNAIINAYGFSGEEMAAFYRSDENWNQGEEFPLFDMSEGLDQKIQMKDIPLHSVLHENHDKLLYVYDFLTMWSFYVELIDNALDISQGELPALLFSLGNLPSQAPDVLFEAENLDLDADSEADLPEDFEDDFGDFNHN